MYVNFYNLEQKHITYYFLFHGNARAIVLYQ